MKRGQLVAYADQRAYTDRLNDIFGEWGWTRTYNVQVAQNFERTLNRNWGLFSIVRPAAEHKLPVILTREEVREIHTLRRWKELLSVAGFLLVAAAAPFFFRVGGGRIRERVWPT